MASLFLEVLGPLRVLIDQHEIKAFESAKVRALLVYLAVESERAHTRDELVGLLWPDYTQASARHSLRQALFNLRSALGDQSSQPGYLIINRDTVQFNRHSDHYLDLYAFNQNYLACQAAMGEASAEQQTCPDGLEEMVSLCRGEFLQGFHLPDCDQFEDWALLQRESLRQRLLEALSYLTGFHTQQGDYATARRFAARQLELDPWREDAFRQMMRLLALDGQRSAALAQYEACKRVLADELDVEPSPETHELYEQIRAGRLSGAGALARPDSLAQAAGQPSAPAPAPVFNLPLQLTPFVGRQAELAQLGELIAAPDSRCITLIGPGGTGKTRLALQAAAEHAGGFTHGVAFVPLAAVLSCEGVIPAITRALKFSFYGPSAPRLQLLNYLQDKAFLLILDNLEQLLVDEAQVACMVDLLVDILQTAPGVKLLLSSREALNLQGEWAFEVGGLAYPEPEAAPDGAEFDAVALFVQRAKRVLPGFNLDGENSADVARICRLVGGMPLAIELAATWMRLLTPREIATEIESSLDFLTTTQHDLPERHRSMRAVFDHSWNMLASPEQAVLCRLSVFRGGFTRQAAEQVAGASLSNLSTLVNRTLLRRTARGRYDLHDLVRQYSAARLASNPAAQAAVQAAHYAFYFDLAQASDQGLKGSEQLEWLGRLEADHDNLRAALEWSLRQDETGEEALQLAAALRLFWRMRGYFHEGHAWLSKALERAPAANGAWRGWALLGLGLLTNSLGEVGAASPLLEESASIFTALGDQAGLAEANLILGLTLRWQGEVAQSHAALREALEIYTRTGDAWGQAQALFRLGSSLSDYSGDMSGRLMLERSAAILEALDEKYLYTMVLTALGIIDKGLGSFGAARANFERSLEIAAALRHPWGMADALTNLGGIYHIQGDYAAAQERFEASLRIYREHGHSMWEADALCALAENELAQGNCAQAHAHLQAISDLLEASANTWLQALADYFRGLLAYYDGDTEQAALWLAEAVMLAREGQYEPDLARSLVALGRVRLALGDAPRARGLVREGLRLFQKLGNQLGMATALEALAELCARQEEHNEAVELFATAHSLRHALGTPLPPIDQQAYDGVIEASRKHIGEPNFTILWRRAARLPTDAVVQKALAGEAPVTDAQK